MPYLGRSSNFGVRTVFQYLPSAGDTSVSGADANGKTLAFADGNYVDVYLNGVKLKTGTDYNTTTANTIAGLTALASNDEVTVVVYDAFSLATGFETLGGTFGDDITFNKDSVELKFGADSEIKLIHEADAGLKLKHTATADNKQVKFTLQTGETDIAANDVLAEINFQAPDEGTGTDAILVAGKIDVLSEGDFSSSSNASSMRFFTGNSAAAGTDGGSMILGSTGNLTLKDLRTADGSSPTITLQSGDTDIAADDILGTINFQAPDEGTGTDAILVAAGIEAVSEGDFSSSSNATKLVFKTGASETATEKMSIASTGATTITVSDNSDTLTLVSTDADANVGPVLNLFRDSASPADNDLIGRIVFKADDDAGNAATFARIEATATDVSNGSEDGRLDFFTAKDDAFNADLSLLGNKVGINTTSPDAQLVIARSSGSSDIAKINLDSDSIDFFTTGKTFNFGTTDSTVIRFFVDNSEAARFHTNGRFSIGASTTFDATNAGVFLSESKGFFTRGSDAPVAINRLTNDGNLVELQQDSNTEGTISVSGSTVSYNGFSGLHESSGIPTDTPIGTVVSTIDELDVYSAKQNGMEGELVDSPKAGQPRTDHAKVEVSDTVGDSAVYGVVGTFNLQGKVNIISVGIGSVRVTGACAKGDLLESNGDGTAKVQDDDIIRSKTIGKVTIGNSNTGVKLVSCVLYCG